MAQKITKTLRLEPLFWDKIEEEAKANNRSANAQIETILRAHYHLDVSPQNDVQKMLAEMKARLDMLETYAIPEVAIEQMADKKKK
mgnify:CR=1 FL=1